MAYPNMEKSIDKNQKKWNRQKFIQSMLILLYSLYIKLKKFNIKIDFYTDFDHKA